MFHAKTKHIEAHYHYIQERVLSSDIDLVYVSTKEQVADNFYKSFGSREAAKI